jgi:hypothetical protein
LYSLHLISGTAKSVPLVSRANSGSLLLPPDGCKEMFWIEHKKFNTFLLRVAYIVSSQSVQVLAQMGLLKSSMRANSLQLSEKGLEVLLKITQVGVYEAAACKRPSWIVMGNEDEHDNRLPKWDRTAATKALVSDKPV